MANYEQALKIVLGIEGGKSNNKADRGGRTNWGITIGTWMRAVRAGLVEDKPFEKMDPVDCMKIYRRFYWDVMRLDEVKDQDIATEMFECGVNCGPADAITYVQEALKCFYPELKIDGIIGTQTLGALDSASKKWKGEILTLQNCLQAIHYMRICQRDQSQLVFLKGWLNKRVEV